MPRRAVKSVCVVASAVRMDSLHSARKTRNASLASTAAVRLAVACATAPHPLGAVRSKPL